MSCKRSFILPNFLFKKTKLIFYKYTDVETYCKYVCDGFATKHYAVIASIGLPLDGTSSVSKCRGAFLSSISLP